MIQDNPTDDAPLGRYKQAADAAYQYAKGRLAKKESSDKLDKEENLFKENIRETDQK